MEYFLRCYFEHFDALPRSSLHDRRKRKSMVDYISTLIEACSAVETDIQETCRLAVLTIIRYHEEKRGSNGTVCMMGKYHNILYVSVKICYDWQLKDVEIVSTLLETIYNCEKTFERILIGAIFGNKAPHFIAGWKCDFDTQEENLRAVVYFIDKANAAGLELPFSVDGEEKLLRFIDLPIENCGKASPLRVCVQLGLPDKLSILLRFGARVHSSDKEESNVFDHILSRLLEFNHVYPYNLVSCLQLLLRVVSTVTISTNESVILDEVKGDTLVNMIKGKYADLIDDGLLPPSRCGLIPPELKHLCRCCIRERLWQNYQLPNGIRTLPVPETLWRYLDILED
ncbi:uncharacterized protein LOC108913449 [Anoplophora glabripennis]|uniref:uncharacterized protein LOC108913449 n=1 Tax=Anoplophora glabripennis TaxID=217634 RepID=UPI0008742CB2|nr:uncharacterized protein LOC108913449 [Anoplophora glabripennis]